MKLTIFPWIDLCRCCYHYGSCVLVYYSPIFTKCASSTEPGEIVALHSLFVFSGSKQQHLLTCFLDQFSFSLRITESYFIIIHVMHAMWRTNFVDQNGTSLTVKWFPRQIGIKHSCPYNAWFLCLSILPSRRSLLDGNPNLCVLLYSMNIIISYSVDVSRSVKWTVKLVWWALFFEDLLSETLSWCYYGDSNAAVTLSTVQLIC